MVLKSSFNRQMKTIPNLSYLQSTNQPDVNLNLYCCGPTVYADSHLGHAITYIRCDLVIRMLKTFCNKNIYFAMNITDIDDKIIQKSNETGVNFQELSNRYFQSFVDDMNSLRVTSPDFVGKVLENMEVIMDYIGKIYTKGYAYISAETGDVNFDYRKFINDYSIQNEMNFGSNQQTVKSIGKQSPKDFALWKVSKPNEPKWNLRLTKDLTITGRPGWHVECSALSEKIFGSKLDIHFGGKDLLFPHHHCESCCSHVYQNDSKNPIQKELYSNANIWLHSGHLNLRTEKMSKSLGNVILIKDFLKKYSANILRLLCIRNHYRTEIDFEEKLLVEMTAIDEKLHEFVQLIEWTIYKLTSDQNPNSLDSQFGISYDSNKSVDHQTLGSLIDSLEEEIWFGLIDDLDLNRSLDCIIKMVTILPKALPFWLNQNSHHGGHNLLLLEFVRLRRLMCRWSEATGLDLLNTISPVSNTMHHTNQLAIVEHLADFRMNIRQSTLSMLNILKKINNNQDTIIKNNIKNDLVNILDHCDRIRSILEKQGIKLKDQRRP